VSLGGGFGFYSQHNASSLKGLATVNRRKHKRPIGGSGQPHKPAIQELTKHSLYCLLDSFHKRHSAPDFLSSFSAWLSYGSKMNMNKGERRKAPTPQGPTGLLQIRTRQSGAELEVQCGEQPLW
jgi:hypothetical protein